MILEGLFFENEMNYPTNKVYPQYPTETAGVQEGTQAIYRYGLRESSYPTLSIADEITNGMGQIIPAGHYELALSDDKQYLILLEAKKPIAVIPVFKVEISMDEKAQVHDPKSLRKKKKHDKEIIRTNIKRARKGMPAVDEEEQIYQEASMEYVKNGDYYLIRYERGDVKAWAAIKASPSIDIRH